MAYTHDMIDKITITKIRHIVCIDVLALMFHNDLTYFMDKMADGFLSGQILDKKYFCGHFFIESLIKINPQAHNHDC